MVRPLHAQDHDNKTCLRPQFGLAACPSALRFSKRSVGTYNGSQAQLQGSSHLQNWPLWKKNLTYFAICFNVLLGAVLSPVLSTCGAQIVEEFKISFNQFALLSGWSLLTSGCAAWLAQASARVWGKRPVYIFSTILLFVTTIWTSRVTSYGSFVAARAIEGLGNGPFESIVLSSVGDLYFVVDPFPPFSNILTSFQVHQRGKPVMFYNMVTLSTVAFSPIIGGYITEKHGWRTQFYVLAGFLFVGLLLLFFACPEHEYHRPPALETDVMAGELSSTREAENEKLPTVEVDTRNTSPNQSAEKPKPYAQELRPFSRNISGEDFFILLARPFVCMLYPAVIWAFFLGGCWSTWVSLTL